MKTSPPIDDIDRAAFDLAIEVARKDPDQRRRFDAMVGAGDDYAEIGRAAAYHCQIESLGLMPWMSPPCYPTMSALDQPYGDAGAKREIAELVLRMRRCGVSRWHPNPVNACEAAGG
ncbi:hypothetical protein [Bradyrhizobium sp. RDM4]|uniref:hypothetical protein n=1 Tax=Bradyrhizobium sp. RDM4 TaxID=3378765 RepID=UPI0038FBEC1F